MRLRSRQPATGTITFSDFFGDAKLLPAADAQMIPTGLNFGTGYNQAYGASSPTSFIVNSNLSPNFPYAAQILGAHVGRNSAGSTSTVRSGMDPTTPGLLPRGNRAGDPAVEDAGARGQHRLVD